MVVYSFTEIRIDMGVKNIINQCNIKTNFITIVNVTYWTVKLIIQKQVNM